MIKKILRQFAVLCGLFSFSLVNAYSCDQTSINVLTAVDNGNGTYTYTVQICLGISPNWGGTDAITIDANVPIVNSGFTPSVSTTYTYCNVDLSFNGQNCETASGNVMGSPPAGGTMTTVTATASGSVGGGNLTYNGTNDLAPGDVGAPAGDCSDCNNPNQLCFNVTFITTGAMTTVQLNNAEQDNNDCGGGACCPTEIDNTIPVPTSGCTPPTASFSSNSPECIGSTFNFSNTGTMTGVTWSWSFPSGSPSSSTSQNPSVTWSAAGSYTATLTTCLTATPTCCSNYSQAVEVTAPPTLSGSGTATTCGLCNGAADLTVTGNGPYSYSWSGGQTSQDLSSLCSGSYTVTVTDNNGCTATRTFTVASSTGPTCAISTSGSSCLTGNSFNFDYTGTTNCSMGNSPVISWSFPGGTPTSSTSDPVSGVTYTTTGTKTATLTVTDCSSPTTCTVTCSTTVTVNPAPTVSISPTNPTCSGTCNGAVTASGAGGTSPYTYSWSGGLGTGASKSSLCAGTYTVTVTDASGCTGTNSVTLTPGLTVTSTFTNSANQCLTGNSFSFTNTGTSGGGVTYSWTFPSGTPSSSTSNNVTGVTWSTAGTYTITHTLIQSGCTSITTGTITVYAQPAVTITPTNPNCNTGCTGQVVAAASGGTAGYTYAWSGGGTSATKTGLCAGTYTVTVTDANNCTATASATLTAPPALTVTATATPATCSGTCNGTLSASGAGGTSPYTYSWNGGLGSGATKSSVCDGTYTVTITDNKGCTATATVTVTEPTAIVPTTSSTNASCNGTCNGSVSVSATGGTSPYSYTWSGTLGMGSPVSSVCDGTYTVTVTDNAGCTITASATVTEPPALTVSTSATDAACNGVCNGTVSVSGSGGVSPYSYLWSGSLGMGSPVSGVCDGIYSVTVTDANSCTVTGSATVNEPALLTVTATPTPATCNGTCDGGLSASASGGTTGYTYTWSGGLGTGATKSSVCDGPYNVTVTDANGCTATTSATVTEPTLLVASASGVDPTCSGVCDGTLTASGSGGVSPYSFNWSGGLGMGSPVANVCAGVYTVTVTDANGCTKTANFTLTAPGALTATATPSPATCNGTCDGSVSAAGSGGTTPYTYTWSGGLGSGATKTGVCDGAYSVTVTDDKGCTTIVNTTVTEPTAVSGTVTANPATCNGTCNGSLSASGSGGISPYTYIWSGGLGSGATKTGVCDGPYSVTITDANGCTNVLNTTVTEPAALSVSISPVDATCNGTCNGTLTASGSGGTTAYTYAWSGGLGTGAVKSGVCAGTYSVTITDANGCTATNSADIDQPAAISLVPSSTNATCGNSNGTGTVVASGGTSPYTYLWCNSQTSSTATGLPAGGCNVTVTDAVGCSETSVATVNSIGGPTVSISGSSDVSCNGGNDGSATASVLGGTSPYTYSWSPSGGSAATASNLAAGTYTINVTDNNGCIASASVTITEPATLLSSISATTNVSCNGLCDGSATVSASGGTTAYSYLWQGGGTSATKTGLCAGSFTVTVTDANGCTSASTAAISEPSALSASAAATAATCNGTCNGSIDLTPAGGTTSYSYSWDNAATTEDLNALCAGSYSVTVTDANGCTVTASAVIIEPAALTLSTSTTNSTCGSSNGTATVSASGGTTGYTYLWENAQTAATATGLSAGSYSVTVTDANGCTASITAAVTDASAPSVSISGTTNVSCFGGNNGSASATITGGATPYTYLWAPSGGTGPNATGLSANNYSVTVTDNNGCTAVATTTITQPGVLGAIISSSANASCNGVCDGSATVTASGGTSPYTYFWQGGGASATKTGLCAGTYNVTISDDNGCAATATATITEPAALTASITGTNTTCNGTCNGAADVTASGGTAPYLYNWSNASTSEDLSSICAGTYDITVTDDKGCTATSSVTINEPAAITTSTSSVNSTCGNSNGEACVSAGGGTSPYTYSWNTTPVQTTSCATGVAAGNYTVTVSDANGCTATASVIVSNSSGGSASATVVSDATGAGLCDGSASASITGGASPYTYLWDNGQATSTSTGLCAGTVCVTVTDDNGCTSVACVIINEPGAIVTSVVVADVSCNGICDGAVDLTVSGGVSPYTYLWSSGATAQDPANLCAGTYTVTVTDNNGVTATASATISEPPAISVTGATTDLTCNNVCSGAIDITAGGGTSPYNYSWSNSSSNEDISSLCAGSYTVTVTDANSCTATSTFTILEPPVISLTSSSVNASCGNANGSASVSVSGGTSPYTYSWSGGSTGATQSNVAAGSYTVTVTDDNGCTASTTVSVNNNSTGAASAAVVNNVLCNGGSTGQASASITGGQSPFTYLWSNGDTGAIADSLTAGTHTVSITDVNNCIATANVFISQPSIIDPSAIATDANCNGICDGGLTAAASGGTSPYTFDWSGGLGSGAVISNVCAGSYTVTITDDNGCVETAAATVGQPSVIMPVTSSVNSTCNQPDGEASVTASGGSSPYTYLWNNTGNSTSSTVTGVPAGTYTVTVTDAAGCTATAPAIVNDNAAPTATASVLSSISCNGVCDGSASVSVSGGTAPYSYLWSNGDSAASADSLCTGTSSVNVTDATGCTASATVTLSQPAILSLSVSGNDVNCNGGNDGDASASASGGTSPYSYSWNTGAGTQNIASRPAGTYVVTVTDDNGCTDSTSITINQPALLGANASASAVLCNSSCDGSLSASGSGGISPYSFSWSGGLGNNATVSNVCTGNYSVTVTDANNCTATDTALVSEPAVLNSFASAADVICNGQCNGSVADSASGGTLPYSFSWDGGLGSGANHNNVCAGTYNVTVTDVNGCTSVQTATVSEPVLLAVSLSSANVSCNGNCDGTAAAVISGGTSPYSYLWDNTTFDTVSSVDSLCSGTYTVSVTDANGCAVSGSVAITQPSPFVLGNSSSGSTCGQSDGSATVTIVSGGVTPYSYQWASTAGSQTTATATGLAAGCYNVTVTNGGGCVASDNICVSDLGAPTVSLLTKTNTSCFGSCDGFAQIAVSGGNPPYNYTWYDSTMTSIGQTTASAFNLCAGTYIGSMVDSTGCIGSISVIITQPAAVSGIISSSDSVSCFGSCDGQAAAAGSGGTSPFSYQWNDLMSQTSASATGLCPGSYAVIISDMNSCDTTISVTVGEPLPVSLAINTNNSFCGTPSGEACVSVSDGVSPFTYLWSDAQTTQCAGNLVPGSYSVTVTDFNGCTAGASATVGNTASGTASVSNIVNASCNGSCDGSASVSMSGSGTSPFTYSWSNGSDSVTATGLCAGTYTVTVTDANNCSSITTATITEPTQLTAITSAIDALCNGVCNGSATVTPAGGTAPYVYSWNDGLAQVSATATGLCAGNYSVTVTDANNCILTATDTVGEPTAVQLSATVFDANCGQANGNACVAVSGGASPYSYLWSDGQANQCLNNVVSGSYNITVTDVNGCSATLGVSIQDLNGPVVSIVSVANATCNGNCDGSASISMSGGAGSYVISWFDNIGNPIFQTNPTASNLCAGTYSATVTDSAGCSASISVTITEPSVITFNQSSVNPTCSGACSGSATVAVSGGSAPYTYLWNDSLNQTAATATGLCAGNYTLTIADSNNCTVFASFTLSNPTLMTASATVTATSCSGVCDGDATVNVFNGNTPFTYQWDTASGNQTTQQAINLCGGSYNVTVTDATGCTATASAGISQPPSINALITTFGNVSCNGDCNGYAQASVSGGSPGYVYSWSDGQINQVASNLCAGIYQVTVMDINGCADTAQVTITQPQALSASINKTNVSCNGNCDGTATLNATGGMPAYTYLWSASAGFQNTATATGLCAGTHSVTITDANGCSKTSSANIIQPTPFAMAVTYFANANCGQNNGQICVNASGGTAPYSYQWNDPFTQTASCADSLYTGCYNINITDASGCTVDSVVCINDIAGPVIALVNSDSVTCSGDANGVIEFSVTGGIGPYTTQWFNGSGTVLPAFNNLNIANGLNGGNYTIQVSDAAGCVASESEFVFEPNPVVAAITATVQNACYGQCLGQATASVAGGTFPYSYLWSPNANSQASPTATALCDGNYFVTVSDVNNCSKILNVTITEPDSISIISTVGDATCNDTCNGSVAVTVSGGTNPYFYSWSPNSSPNPSAFGLCAGTYTTSITDNNGCVASVNNTIAEPSAIIVAYTTADATCGSCNGQASLSVSGGSPNYSYQWFNGQNSSSSSGLCMGISSVTVTDMNGCTINIDVTISNIGGPVIDSVAGISPKCTGSGDGEAVVFVSGGTPGYSYLWNDPLQSQNDSIFWLNGGNYFVTVTDANGCSAVQGVNISEPSPMQAVGTGDTTLCYGQSTQVWTTGSGGSGSYVYQWTGQPWFTSGPHTVNPVNTTDYCFTVYDDFGCSATGCITVAVKPELQVTVQGGVDTVNICFKDSVSLCALASQGNSGPYTYTWVTNNFIDSVASPSCQTVNPLVNTSYIVIASDGCSLNDTDTVTVLVHDIPIASFLTTPDKGCPPLTASFNTVDPGVPNAAYSWDFDGDGNFGDDTTPFPEYVYTESDTYTVSLIVTSEFGCADTFTVPNYVIVHPVPAADIDHSPETGSLINPEIEFTDGFTNGATNWAWEFGDGETGAGENPSHVYSDTGTYYVTLVVMNDQGCLDTIQDTVVIKSEFAIFVPNAFTPNGNDKNEFFMAQGVGIDLDNYVMYIFDRWGDLIWETHDLYKGWDGTANGGSEMVQQDVYVWLIICYDLHGNKHRLIGHVTVVK